MSVLLLTMGPPLGLVMDTPNLRVGEPGTITLRAPGALGDVKWAVVESDLPAEWGTITPDDTEATISTAEALEWGEYTITVRVVDSLRTPVLRTFSVWVEPEAITVAAGGTREWNVGTPVSLPLAITGGTGVYVSAKVASGILPAGITASVAGSTLQISGTPTTVSDSEATITVSDSREAQGMTSLDWEVTSPPKILIGGVFTQINGVTANRIARLNHDGTLDTSFTTSVTGGSTQVSRILVLPTGKIMICGVFTHVNGVVKNYIARLYADGTLDTSFHCAPAGQVTDMVPQPSGKVIIVGFFTNVNGSANTNRYARINEDGSTDTSFGPCSANNQIISACALPSGRTLVSGYFTTIGGVGTTGKLAVLNADGTVDASFVPAISGSDGGYVTQFSVQGDGKILAAGKTTSIFGTTVYTVFRLNTDLTLDSSFLPQFYYPSNPRYVAVQLSTGDVFVGGSFNQMWNGSKWVTRNYAGSAGETTGLVTSFNPNPNQAVFSALELPNGDIVMGGDFTQVGGISRSRIARVTSSGSLVSGFTPTANSTVRTGALQFL